MSKISQSGFQSEGQFLLVLLFLSKYKMVDAIFELVHCNDIMRVMVTRDVTECQHNLSKFGLVGFLKQLPNKFPQSCKAAGSKLVHHLLLCLLLLRKILLHPVELVLATRLKVKIIWNSRKTLSEKQCSCFIQITLKWNFLNYSNNLPGTMDLNIGRPSGRQSCG